MNSIEIRIGNYVEMESEVVKVVAICCKEDGRVEVQDKHHNNHKVSINSLTPISLNRELLATHCSFDKYAKHVIGIDQHRYYLKFKDGYIVLLNQENEAIIHFWDVKQLHQLQNLYFALKGREMVIDLIL